MLFQKFKDQMDGIGSNWITLKSTLHMNTKRHPCKAKLTALMATQVHSKPITNEMQLTKLNVGFGYYAGECYRVGIDHYLLVVFAVLSMILGKWAVPSQIQRTEVEDGWQIPMCCCHLVQLEASRDIWGPSLTA